jgi:hypothetical protein
MATYTIYLDCPMSYGWVHAKDLCYRDNLSSLYIHGKYYLIYKGVLLEELEYHILRLTDLGHKVLQVIPNKNV